MYPYEEVLKSSQILKSRGFLEEEKNCLFPLPALFSYLGICSCVYMCLATCNNM